MQIKAIIVSSLLVAFASASPTPVAKRAVAEKWAQCAGKNWTGPTECPEKWHCEMFSYGSGFCYPNPTQTPVHE
ncbi:hypothetical protein TWF281_008477 [Arthrobotrys megalospora]